MTPLMIGQVYTLRWAGEVYPHMRYVGRDRGLGRDGRTLISGPVFVQTGGARHLVASWVGIEIELETAPAIQAPAVIDGSYSVV